MLPALVLPFHDPSGRRLDLLTQVTPVLRQRFSRVFLSVSPATERSRAEQLAEVQSDPFFLLNANAPASRPGEHYCAAFVSAVTHTQPEQLLLIADIDKLAAVLHSASAERFLADLGAQHLATVPRLFQRSAQAWTSYPRPYREIEHVAITLGTYLFGRYLDWAWSYLVISNAQLHAILPQLRQREFGLLAEVVLAVLDTLHTQEVDWLFWEDPFEEGRDADELRAEREASTEETRKLLQMNAPILELLLEQIHQRAYGNESS